MGAGQSIPSTLTRQKAYELTRDTRGMMDVLLDYMLKEITVRDFLALSNPNECKKYVVFLANNLYKQFYELQIKPVKDKQGIIAFRPVSELTKPSETDDSERQSLCLVLAYFYTRIFQIYGALALTVIDDARVLTESGILPYLSDGAKKGLLAPGYRPFTTSGGAISGGAISAAALGNFNFLRSYLIDERDPLRGYITLYSGEGDSRGRIYFAPKIEERDEFGRAISTSTISEAKLQRGIFFIGYSGGKLYSQLEAYSRIEGIDADTKFTFGKLKFYKKEGIAPETIELPLDVLTQRQITIQRTIGARAYVYSIKGSTKSIAEYFNDIFAKVVEFIKRNTIEETGTIRSPSGVIISETGTAEELRLAKMVQALTRDKPLSHCIARAMQLLNTYPLGKDTEGVSYICKAKFLEQTKTTSTGTKTTVSRSGIPQPGSPIDTSPGIFALSQLFYDTIDATPKIKIGTEGKPSTLDKYIEFMIKLGRDFGDTYTVSKLTGPPDISRDTIIKAGIGAIRNKRDQALCKDIPENLQIPSTNVNSVYQIVNKLLQIQVRHSAECGKIIKLLFNIERDKGSPRYRISLSDNIIKKGFPEIQRINYLAREVLVNYYSNCENTYAQGMKKVLLTSPQSAEIIKKRIGSNESKKPTDTST
jgi:hypothetical protein